MLRIRLEQKGEPLLFSLLWPCPCHWWLKKGFVLACGLTGYHHSGKDMPTRTPTTTACHNRPQYSIPSHSATSRVSNANYTMEPLRLYQQLHSERLIPQPCMWTRGKYVGLEPCFLPWLMPSLCVTANCSLPMLSQDVALCPSIVVIAQIWLTEHWVQQPSEQHIHTCMYFYM